jgi:hypothetical protein
MGGVVGVLLAQIQLARALIKKELQIKKFFSHPLHIFSTLLFSYFSLKKTSERVFQSLFCLENKFWNVFSELFLKFELEKTHSEFFLRGKLKY